MCPFIAGNPAYPVVPGRHEQGDPVGEALWNPGQARPSEIGAFLEQRPQQADNKQRIRGGRSGTPDELRRVG